MIIEFRGWMPDQPDNGNPGEVTAENVLPQDTSYIPLPDLSAQSTNALDARCQGATAVTDNSGNAIVFAGDATKLQKIDAGLAFSDVSKVGGYSTPTDGGWEFTLFGTQLVATNYADPVQQIDVLTGSNFADLITSTNKPKAKHCATVGNFLMLGNTFDSTDGTRPSRLWWSAFRDTADFDPDAATQSDFEDIAKGGAVQRIVGREYATVFQERQIQRASYEGPPTIFRLDVIDDQRGTPIPGSVVSWGRYDFFISEEGFMATVGGESQPLGDGRVDKEFWALFAMTYRHRVFAAIDPVKKIVLWAFPTSSSPDGTPDRIFACHWPTKKWAYADLDLEILFQSVTFGYTLDALDSVSTSIDALPFSLDSTVWASRGVQLSAFNTSHKIANFSGSNLAALIDTGEKQLFEGYTAKTRRIRPIVDTSSATIKIASRKREADTATFGSAISQTSEGWCPVHKKGRYQRFRLDISAAALWNFARGVEVEAFRLGRR